MTERFYYRPVSESETMILDRLNCHREVWRATGRVDGKYIAAKDRPAQVIAMTAAKVAELNEKYGVPCEVVESQGYGARERWDCT